MFSVNARLLLVCVFAFSVVFAAVPGKAHFNYIVKTQNEETSESVDVNYQDNYVQITTQGQKQPIVLIHDYTQGLNLVKQNDQCFMMDKFQDIPENIEDWVKVKKAKVGDTVLTDADVLYIDYFFKALPFALDRNTLPAVIQRICSDTILVLVLEGTREGKTAHMQTLEQLGDNKARCTVLLPGRSLPKRVKRQSYGSLLTKLGPLFRGNANQNIENLEPVVDGKVTYKDGPFTGEVSANHNLDNHNTNVNALLNFENGPLTYEVNADHNLNNHNTNVNGQLNYENGPLTGTVNANHNIDNDITNVNAQLNYKDHGGLTYGVNANHNLDNHNTNYGLGINYDNGKGLSWRASGNYIDNGDKPDEMRVMGSLIFSF